MNKYFFNVGENLKREIPNKPNSLINGIYNVNRDSKEFHFSEISEGGIISVISTFRTSKGSGQDSIPNFFMKIVIHVIAKPLAFLFNSSLFQGVFPDNWKHARVSSIFKDGSTDIFALQKRSLPCKNCIYDMITEAKKAPLQR